MDYQEISTVAKSSLISAMNASPSSQASQEQLAQVISAGIVAAIQEYDRQLNR